MLKIGCPPVRFYALWLHLAGDISMLFSKIGIGEKVIGRLRYLSLEERLPLLLRKERFVGRSRHWLRFGQGWIPGEGGAPSVWRWVLTTLSMNTTISSCAAGAGTSYFRMRRGIGGHGRAKRIDATTMSCATEVKMPETGFRCWWGRWWSTGC